MSIEEWDDVTAQDLIDCLRLVFITQKDPVEVAKLVDALMEYAPETASDRGVQLLTKLLVEGPLKASLA